MQLTRPSSPLREGSVLERIALLAAGWVALLLLGWAAGELVRSAFGTSETAFLAELAEGRTGGLTPPAHALSFFGSSAFVIPATAVVALLLCRSGRRTDALATVIAVLGAAGISTVDKLLVARARPSIEHLEAVTSASFPSGHSTAAAAFGVALILVIVAVGPRRSLAAVAAALTIVLVAGVALSRMYLGVHYPSDVVAGLLLGGAWSALAVAVVRGRGPGRPSRTSSAGRAKGPSSAGASAPA